FLSLENPDADARRNLRVWRLPDPFLDGAGHQISPAVSAKLAPLDNSSSSIRASSRSIFMIPTSSRSCRCRSLSISLGLARSVRVCSRTVQVRVRADADGEPFPASLEASRRDCFLLADASALSRVALLMRLSDLRHPDLPAGASPPARCRRARRRGCRVPRLMGWLRRSCGGSE